MTPETRDYLISQYTVHGFSAVLDCVDDLIAAAVAAAVAGEREACAKACDAYVGNDTVMVGVESPWHQGADFGTARCAKAIRARGEGK